MKKIFEMPDAGLLATRELRIPLQIAEQSSTSLTHFDKTCSRGALRPPATKNPKPQEQQGFGGGGGNS